MDDPKLIEAMARALCLADHGFPDAYGWCEGERHYDWMLYRENAADALAALRSAGMAVNVAARDVLAERARQVSVEGWTPEHDDKHTDGSLAAAAACYAHQRAIYVADAQYDPRGGPQGPTYYRNVKSAWPDSWSWKWWKPQDRRRNLVKAAALVLAEIERLDRAMLNAATGEIDALANPKVTP